MTRPRRLGKRQLERANRTFEDAANAELDAHGAVYDGSFHRLLPTRAGLLLAHAIPSDTGPGGFVALRFDDVEAARAFLQGKVRGDELNVYSGKWNLHLFGEWFGEGCGDRIRSALRLRLEQVALPSDVGPEERARLLADGVRAREARLARMFGREPEG